MRKQARLARFVFVLGSVQREPARQLLEIAVEG